MRSFRNIFKYFTSWFGFTKPRTLSAVELDEIVARFVVVSKLNRLVFKDGGAKPQLFYPYKHIELSVNRHLDCSEDEIWQFGYGVADHQKKPLQGRFDIRVEDCTFESLRVKASPIKNDPNGVADNPYHADIIGFPDNKADQKSLGLKLAEKAGKRIPPPREDDSN